MARRTEAFGKGQFGDMADMVETPLPIFRGAEVRIFRSRKEIVVYLTDWRDALLRIGYDRSDYKILDAVISPGGRLRMHLRWFNRDRTGAVISTPEMNYYLSRVSDRGWRISMIDVLVPDQAATTQ